MPYLAAYPQIQEWVRAEVDAVLPEKGTVDYAQTYPKLVRCLAVLYEILRTAGPVAQLVRAPITTTMLPVPSDQPGGHSKTIAVEPNTLVSAHFHALHLSPRWGQDSMEFKPKRFVAVAEDGSETLTVPQGDGALYAAVSTLSRPYSYPCSVADTYLTTFVVVIQSDYLSRKEIQSGRVCCCGCIHPVKVSGRAVPGGRRD